MRRAFFSVNAKKSLRPLDIYAENMEHIFCGVLMHLLIGFLQCDYAKGYFPMHFKPCVGLMLTLFGLAAVPAARAQVFIAIDPTATYLHTNQDSAIDSPALLLSSLVFNGHALQAGDEINLSESGDFLLSIYVPEIGYQHAGFAVFSSSDTLLDSSLLNRVPGAIKAGTDFVTDFTYHGHQPTDIPEDFLFTPDTGTNVVIPAGARYLFLSAADSSLYGDNGNPNHDFGVNINYVAPAAVPEASTTASLGLLLVLGLIGLAVSRRRKASSLR